MNEEAQKKMGEELLEICNLAQEGLCLESKWGKCIFPEHDNDNGHKCGLCFAKYIVEQLGYRKLPDKPPLLSDEEMEEISSIFRYDKSSFRKVVQAQWDICVKYYGGTISAKKTTANRD